MKLRSGCYLWLALGLLIGPSGVLFASPEPLPEKLRVGAETVAAARLEAWVAFLASPVLEGRATGARGFDIAAQFSRSVFARLGLEPAGDVSQGETSYFQELSLKKGRGESPPGFTRNVIAMLPGSDPTPGAEYIVLGAHLDHLGTEDQSVYPGADDNASGVAALFAVAAAFAKSPARPRRSILFILYTGEESSLMGSRHFVKHPTVPLEKIVAKIQLDMIGRDEENDDETADENRNSVHLIGSQRHSRDFHQLILAQNRQVGLDFEYDEEEHVYTRSDHYPFAKEGIPVAFFFTGFHRDYHSPRDTLDKLNYAKLERITRLVYLVAHELGDRSEPLEKLRKRGF